MASNYYGYNYGNSSYPQNQQSFPDQYSSTAPAAPSQAAPSQPYYGGGQAQVRQRSSTRSQATTENRPTTTQYNGLHFPAPAPSRQTVATTSRDLGSSAGSAGNVVANTVGGGARSNASNMGNAGYAPGGGYQSSNKKSTSQARQRVDVTAARTHDRAEHALSASTSTGWNAGNTGSSTVHTTSSATDYGYPYNKPDIVSQQQNSSNYYGSQRASTAPSTSTTAQATTLNSGYDPTQSYSSSAPQPSSSSTSSKSSAQRQMTQTYQQPAQSTSKTPFNSNYEASSTKTSDSNATAYQQPADYSKAYHDDTDHSQSYLHRVYSLPQPTLTRHAADTAKSYFTNTHTEEASYAPSSQTSKPNPIAQTPSYDRAVQASGRSSAAAASATSSSSYDYSGPAQTSTQHYHQQQYYQDYATGNLDHPQVASYTSAVAPTAITTQTTPISAPKPTANSAPKARKPRQSASKISPTTKPPKPRASRKPKASAGSSPSVGTSDSKKPSSLPQPHLFYPPDIKSNKASGDVKMTQGTPASTERSPSPTSAELKTMEQHMREMVEKMREYQSRDPTAFQQVWENVKRAAPGAGAGGKGVSLPMTGSKSTSGVGSPQQTAANLAKSTRQTAGQSTPAGNTGQASSLGSAASQAQKTVWPASQKVALSQTASKFFTKLGQSCSEAYVMSLLDYGPTFTELCLKLEAESYKFERNALASELLRTSESVDSSQAAASTAGLAISAATPSTDAPPRTVTPRSIKSFNPRNIKDSIPNLVPQDKDHDHSQNFVAPSMIYREVSYPIHFGRLESNVRSDESIAPPSPAAGSASSLRSIPEKSIKPAIIKKRISMATVPQNLLKDPQQVTNPGPQPQVPVAQVPDAPQSSFSHPPGDEPMPDASPVSMMKPISRYENLIQASLPVSAFIQSQAEEDNSAISKLQSKLEAQMSRLKQLGEPVEPPSPTVSAPSQRTPASQPPPPPPQSTRKVAFPKPPALDKKKALRRNNYDPLTIVNAVLHSTGRHPQYEGLNSRLAILKRLHPDAFDNSTDLAAIPWDLLDPPPEPLPGDARKPRRSMAPEEEEMRGRGRAPVPFTTSAPRVEPKPVVRADPAPVTPTFEEGKIRGKRGRPRGSRGVSRAARGGRGGATEAPNTGTNFTGNPSTAANTHKYGNVTRNNINTLRNGRGGGYGGSSRKRKYDNSQDSREYPGDGNGNGGTWGSNASSRMIPVFKCQWENCKYELQNLETLRVHLIKKHKAENIQSILQCCWGKCGTLVAVSAIDPETGRQTLEQRRRRLNFGTGMAWDDHVLGGHLKNLRDELGEGMSVSEARSLSRDSSAHSVEGRLRSMSRDRTGRSITPVITPAPYGYKFTPPPGFSGGRKFRIAHEFPQEIEIDNDVDEQKKVEDELARLGLMGAGMESFDIFNTPGAELDNEDGWTTKVRKLTTDLNKVTPLPPQPEGDGHANREKGKGRVSD